MKVIRKEKQMKEVEVTIEKYNLCDKCNEKIEAEDKGDAFECDFIYKTGISYPEGGSGRKQAMELCQKCAVELVALLRENGYRVTDSEWDW
jgi:uncharacterized protein with PIN domain